MRKWSPSSHALAIKISSVSGIQPPTCHSGTCCSCWASQNHTEKGVYPAMCSRVYAHVLTGKHSCAGLDWLGHVLKWFYYREWEHLLTRAHMAVLTRTLSLFVRLTLSLSVVLPVLHLRKEITTLISHSSINRYNLCIVSAGMPTVGKHRNHRSDPLGAGGDVLRSCKTRFLNVIF